MFLIVITESEEDGRYDAEWFASNHHTHGTKVSACIDPFEAIENLCGELRARETRQATINAIDYEDD